MKSVWVGLLIVVGCNGDCTKCELAEYGRRYEYKLVENAHYILRRPDSSELSSGGYLEVPFKGSISWLADHHLRLLYKSFNDEDGRSISSEIRDFDSTLLRVTEFWNGEIRISSDMPLLGVYDDSNKDMLRLGVFGNLPKSRFYWSVKEVDGKYGFSKVIVKGEGASIDIPSDSLRPGLAVHILASPSLGIDMSPSIYVFNLDSLTWKPSMYDSVTAIVGEQYVEYESVISILKDHVYSVP